MNKQPPRPSIPTQWEEEDSGISDALTKLCNDLLVAVETVDPTPLLDIKKLFIEFHNRWMELEAPGGQAFEDFFVAAIDYAVPDWKGYEVYQDIQRRRFLVDLVGHNELMDLIHHFLGNRPIQPSFAWYWFKEGILRNLRAGVNDSKYATCSIPFIGKFLVKVYYRYTGKHPVTGAEIVVPPKAVAIFKGVRFKSVDQNLSNVPSIDQSILLQEIRSQCTLWNYIPESTQIDQETIITMVGAVIQALYELTTKQKRRIVIEGIGTVWLQYKPPLYGRNPQTGEQIELPGRTNFTLINSSEIEYVLSETLHYKLQESAN